MPSCLGQMSRHEQPSTVDWLGVSAALEGSASQNSHSKSFPELGGFSGRQSGDRQEQAGHQAPAASRRLSQQIETTGAASEDQQTNHQSKRAGPEPGGPSGRHLQ